MRRGVTLGSLAAGDAAFSFLFQWILLTRLGPGGETDAFFAAVLVPQIALSVVIGAVTPALVPLLAVADPATRRRTGWSFAQALGLAFAAVGTALWLAAPLWVGALFPGFGRPTVELTVALLGVQVVTMTAVAVHSALAAVQQAQERFVRLGASTIAGGVVAVAVLLALLPRFGVRAAAWGAAAEGVVQVAILAPMAGRFAPLDLRAPAVREAWARLRPMLSATVLFKSDRLVDRYLASLAPAGVLSLLHLAQQAMSVGMLITTRALGTPLVPAFARLARSGQWDELEERVRRGAGLTLAATSAAVVVLVFAGRPLIGAVFEHGRFSPGETALLWQLLLASAGMLVAGCTGSVFANAFYAQGDTRTVAAFGVLAFGLGVAAKIGGFSVAGATGIALGASLYHFLMLVFLGIFFRRRLALLRRPSAVLGARLT
jgi:putative peptidoglycan lipid II flippase